jgi:eukaryotic-like serine/threonine-protein kinase
MDAATFRSTLPEAIADYVVVRLLGEGNHGRYYLARPPARLGIADEFVALKVFGDQVSDLAYDRGVRELRAFAAVRSPYLVTVYDAVLEDTFAYAMQYFPAGSLAAPSVPVTRPDVVRALEHAARAAHALHESGIAHGDIKPANVLLAADGGRLSDLGIARFMAPGATLTSMGRASSVEFLDPDLIGGARPSRRTEVWALGATIHRVLAGVGLYGELPDTQALLAIRKVLAGTPQISPSLAPDAAELVRRCLADDERPQTAEAVAEGLARLAP